MTKIDWLIAILIMVMGLMCMIFSAIYFRNGTFIENVSNIKTFCFWMTISGAIILLIYFWLRRKIDNQDKQ
ncbi:hypothetical protein EEL32_23965 [Brevibacillus laterosporus]|uniref:Uncharacterized protein n=1 Tax=Brevibacillus laterosporus TaxID=1465 RepID=A0A502HRI8_BRELA|nr:hypothetical protein [Brevibacillus laterosporus]QDX94084.1 hypothetical protein EEL30_18405 [Brevibacillus laterosporus]TPG75992.1 hypothetical protein EEL32_23965 [Brevibacillus laterosporus]